MKKQALPLSMIMILFGEDLMASGFFGMNFPIFFTGTVFFTAGAIIFKEWANFYYPRRKGRD